ncbi:hypothetical protein BDF22DRAFT_775022 [Syncephalis plumigaleata]|nr:hypothetical protein BDF22DRAFT_775022 [Syncephalis plumigaleata]
MYLQVAIDYRVWNRDMAACLNFIQIIRSVRKDKGIPTQFQRRAVPPPDHGCIVNRHTVAQTTVAPQNTE